jgi:hypothetical protein
MKIYDGRVSLAWQFRSVGLTAFMRSRMRIGVSEVCRLHYWRGRVIGYRRDASQVSVTRTRWEEGLLVRSKAIECFAYAGSFGCGTPR